MLFGDEKAALEEPFSIEKRFETGEEWIQVKVLGFLNRIFCKKTT